MFTSTSINEFLYDTFVELDGLIWIVLLCRLCHLNVIVTRSCMIAISRE